MGGAGGRCSPHGWMWCFAKSGRGNVPDTLVPRPGWSQELEVFWEVLKEVVWEVLKGVLWEVQLEALKEAA